MIAAMHWSTGTQPYGQVIMCLVPETKEEAEQLLQQIESCGADDCAGVKQCTAEIWARIRGESRQQLNLVPDLEVAIYRSEQPTEEPIRVWP